MYSQTLDGTSITSRSSPKTSIPRKCTSDRRTYAEKDYWSTQKNISKVVIPKEFISIDKAVISEEISSSIQVLNSCFVDEIQNPGIHKVYEKSCLVLQTGNDKNNNLELTQLPIIDQAYNLDQEFYIRSLFKLVSPLDVSSDSVVKFATHHSYYKDITGNPTQNFACAANCLSFSCGWSNLLEGILAHIGGACAAKLELVTKNRKLARTSLYLFSYQLPFLLSFELSKMRLAIFKYPLMSKCLVISKCATMSKW